MSKTSVQKQILKESVPKGAFTIRECGSVVITLLHDKKMLFPGTVTHIIDAIDGANVLFVYKPI